MGAAATGRSSPEPPACSSSLCPKSKIAEDPPQHQVVRSACPQARRHVLVHLRLVSVCLTLTNPNPAQTVLHQSARSLQEEEERAFEATYSEYLARVQKKADLIAEPAHRTYSELCTSSGAQVWKPVEVKAAEVSVPVPSTSEAEMRARLLPSTSCAEMRARILSVMHASGAPMDVFEVLDALKAQPPGSASGALTTSMINKDTLYKLLSLELVNMRKNLADMQFYKLLELDASFKKWCLCVSSS